VPSPAPPGRSAPGRPLRGPAAALAAALAALVLAAGCGSPSPDNGGALAGSVPTGSAASPTPRGALPVTQAKVGDVAYPVVGGAPAAARIDAALLATARSLTGKGGCSVQTRADTGIVSARWTCAGSPGPTANYRSQTGQVLSLDDLFVPGYLTTLSQTAVTQLQLGGLSPAAARAAAPPTLAAFRRWSVDDSSLVVTFATPGLPATISFPLASLAGVTASGGPLGPR
jgi:hypothetical protein